MRCLYTPIFSSDLNCVHVLVFACAQLQGPSQLGGNPGRVSSSDAAILANASGPIGLMSHNARPRPKPSVNPITGERPKLPPPRSLRNSLSESSFGSKPMLFPARGTINSIGSLHSDGSPTRSSPHKSRRAGKLEYELWCEAQRRSAAERELRQVQIHGRSRPPWIGDAESSGYRSLSKSDLMPQTVR